MNFASTVVRKNKHTGLYFPWGLALFLLGVFALTHPFDASNAGQVLAHSLEETVELAAKGSMARRVGMLTLGLYAVVCLLGRRRNRFRVDGLLGCLFVFYILLAIASIAWTDAPLLVVRRVTVLILLWIGALGVLARYSPRDVVALTFVVCGSTLLVSLTVELFLGTFHPFAPSWRFAGVIHPVAQGWNCGLLALSGFALSQQATRRRGLYVLASLTAMVFLLITKSRMPFFTALLSVALYWAVVSARAPKIIFWLGYGLAACICFLYLALGNELKHHAVTAAALGRAEEASESLGTLTGRLDLWKECLRYAEKRPFAGYGYNAFLSPRNLPEISQATGWVPSSPHSGYIGTLLGLGWLGAATLALMLSIGLKKSISLSKRVPSYAFSAAVLLWLSCNLLLEAALITDPTFPTFLCLIVLVGLSFKHEPSLTIRSSSLRK